MSVIGKVGPYSSPDVLGKLDGRTKEARLLRETRADLIAHVGGKPSATQRALIERASQLTLRIAMMDSQFAASGIMPEHVSRTYLAWSNTLARTLGRIGMKAVAQQSRSLSQHIAERQAAA